MCAKEDRIALWAGQGRWRTARVTRTAELKSGGRNYEDEKARRKKERRERLEK
jgi:hypothetical protein